MTTEPQTSPPQTKDDGASGKSTSSFGRFFTFAVVGFILTTVLVFYVAGQVTPTAEKTFEITPQAKPLPSGEFQLTIDARNNGFWVPINLSLGKEVQTEEQADILVKRYFLRAPKGAMNLGQTALEEAVVPKEAQWVKDAKYKGQLQNEALANWYQYSSMTHVLKVNKRTNAVKLKSGGVAFFEILSYYCKPEGSGCLTLRYRLQHDDAS